MEKVQKTTRAGKAGKQITCPICSSFFTAYHFAWSAMVCPNCRNKVEKYDWYLDS